jgi:hypothetical protein
MNNKEFFRSSIIAAIALAIAGCGGDISHHKAKEVFAYTLFDSTDGGYLAIKMANPLYKDNSFYKKNVDTFIHKIEGRLSNVHCSNTGHDKYKCYAKFKEITSVRKIEFTLHRIGKKRWDIYMFGKEKTAYLGM